MTEKKEKSQEYIAMRDLAISQLLSGKTLTGKGRIFSPIIKFLRIGYE